MMCICLRLKHEAVDEAGAISAGSVEVVALIVQFDTSTLYLLSRRFEAPVVPIFD